MLVGRRHGSTSMTPDLRQSIQSARLSRRSLLSVSAVGTATLLTGALLEMEAMSWDSRTHHAFADPSDSRSGSGPTGPSQLSNHSAERGVLAGARQRDVHVGFNGSYLGPTLRMTRGDTVSMLVSNQLEVTTAVHWHGMHLPAAGDSGPATTDCSWQ